MSNYFTNSLKINGSEVMEYTFRIYPTSKDGHARELIATQTAKDLDDAINEATMILGVIKKSAKVVFMIENDEGKEVAGISPEVEEWVKF